MELSVVIPVYNEEENIEPLMREVDDVLSPLGKTYEIVAVDDGSKDGTFTALRKIRCRLPIVKAVRSNATLGRPRHWQPAWPMPTVTSSY
jgi:glycosyltransferase involved in cell wall biosynthesis